MKHGATWVAILALAILSTPQTFVAQAPEGEEVEMLSLVLEHMVHQLRATEGLWDGPVRVDDRVAEAKSGLTFTKAVHSDRAQDAISAKKSRRDLADLRSFANAPEQRFANADYWIQASRLPRAPPLFVARKPGSSSMPCTCPMTRASQYTKVHRNICWNVWRANGGSSRSAP
jgi:hypothetical protein